MSEQIPHSLRAWLRLAHSPGVGFAAQRRWLAAFGDAEAILQTPKELLAREAGPAAAQALLATNAERERACDAALAWLQRSPQHHCLCLNDEHYPPHLREISDAPPLLYAWGDLSFLHASALAIVGSRSATPQGVQIAQQYAAHLSERGICIVSGLALGIDAAAHEGALTSTGGTIAVLGTGIDRIYPRSHEALAERIAARGLLLSDFAIGTPPLGSNFPRRNRLIAALSQGVLVVEAALGSGSLITARLAAEMGREVFAIPGSIHAPQSRGCHQLIKQGAKLVESAEDVFEELRFDSGFRQASLLQPLRPALRRAAFAPRVTESAASVPGAARPERLNAQQQNLLSALGFAPTSLDALAEQTGQSAAELSAQLLEMELAGVLTRLPGGAYQRLGNAAPPGVK